MRASARLVVPVPSREVSSIHLAGADASYWVRCSGPRAGQFSFKIAEMDSGAAEPKAIFIIHAVVQIGIEIAVFF